MEDRKIGRLRTVLERVVTFAPSFLSLHPSTLSTLPPLPRKKRTQLLVIGEELGSMFGRRVASNYGPFSRPLRTRCRSLCAAPESYSRKRQFALVTFCALSPRSVLITSNCTGSPSLRVLNPSP